MTDRMNEPQLRQLQEQLIAARVQWREDYAREKGRLQALHDAAEKRDQESKQLYSAAKKEHDRLKQLRAKFITRWKRQWTQERQTLQAERQRLQQQQQEFDDYRLRANQELTQRENRLESAQNEWHANQQKWQQQYQSESMQLQQDQKRVQEQQKALDRRVDEFQKQQDLQQKKVDRLRSEVDGLETRSQHLRRVVEELERKRQTWLDGDQSVTADDITGRLKELSGPIHESVVVVKSPGSEREQQLDARQKRLEKIAQEILDQRAYLIEQLNRLTIAKEIWRAEEKRTLEEIETIAIDVKNREELSRPREKVLQQKELDLQRRSFQLATRQRDIELGRSRLHAQQVSWNAQKERLEAEYDQQKKRTDQLRQDLDTLLKEVAQIHRHGKHQLHEQLESLKLWEQQWRNHYQEIEAYKSVLARREREIDTDFAAVEQAKYDLMTNVRKELAEKKIERYRKRISGSFRRETQLLEKHRLQTQQSQQQIAEKLQLIQMELPTLVRTQLELNEKEVTLLAQAKSANRQLVEAASYAEQFRQTQNRYEKETEDLRQEVNRLQERLLEMQVADEQPMLALRAA